MHYEPGDVTVGKFQRPGSVLIEIPELGSQLYRSNDGSTWILNPTSTVGARQLTLAGPFTAPGYYLAATNVPELVATTSHSSEGAVVAGIVTGVVAIAILALAFFVARRRRGGSRSVGDKAVTSPSSSGRAG